MRAWGLAALVVASAGAGWSLAPPALAQSGRPRPAGTHGVPVPAISFRMEEVAPGRVKTMKSVVAAVPPAAVPSQKLPQLRTVIGAVEVTVRVVLAPPVAWVVDTAPPLA